MLSTPGIFNISSHSRKELTHHFVKKLNTHIHHIHQAITGFTSLSQAFFKKLSHSLSDVSCRLVFCLI